MAIRSKSILFVLILILLIMGGCDGEDDDGGGGDNGGNNPDYPIAGGTYTDGCLINGRQLIDEGAGYYHYLGEDDPGTDNWGTNELLDFIKDVGRNWGLLRTRIGILDLSLRKGGPFPPHTAHQNGLDVDVRYVRIDLESLPVTIYSEDYDQDLSRELIKAFLDSGASVIFSSDNGLLDISGVSFVPQHDDHFHVRLPYPGPIVQCRGSLSKTGILPGSGVQILRVGSYHGNEIAAMSGEEWFGVFPTGDGFELMLSTIVVETVNDPVVDGDFGMSGKKVSVNEKTEPLFLIKNLNNLSEGAVETLFAGNKLLCPNDSIHLEMKNRDHYFIEVIGDGDKIDFCVADNYRIELLHQGLSQEIIALKHVADGKPALLWAGDIDRDGKLDLFIDETSHYNTRLLKLYLSSTAKENRIVQEVAKFISTAG